MAPKTRYVRGLTPCYFPGSIDRVEIFNNRDDREDFFRATSLTFVCKEFFGKYTLIALMAILLYIAKTPLM